MDLAQTFNHAGCIYFEREQYVAAYDAFCAAHQALLYSAKGLPKCQLDDHCRTMLVMDPAIQRAYDRIAMSGLFKSSSSRSTAYHHSDDNKNHTEGIRSNDDDLLDDHDDYDNSETSMMKPIMMMMTMPMDDHDEASVLPFGVSESSCQRRHAQFVTNMAIVWTNKGLVQQSQGNRDRSLTCYALARSWMCQTFLSTGNTYNK